MSLGGTMLFASHATSVAVFSYVTPLISQQQQSYLVLPDDGNAIDDAKWKINFYLIIIQIC